jgi:hypothetical protein
MVHLHEKHLHHVEEKLEQTNKLLADLFGSQRLVLIQSN